MDAYKYSKVKDRVALCSDTRLCGDPDARINALISGLFTRVDMKATVDFFRYRLDMFAAGEFFGKLMRAACLIYRYTKDRRLKEVIDGAAADIMSVQDEDGDISTSPKEKQPDRGSGGADLWERKYVLLGLLEYYAATEDEKVLDCMMKLARYTASQIGEPPKTPVTKTGWAFCGIESSSILEPVVRLYNMTGDGELLELASHIVRSGACSREDVFEAVLAGKDPKDIGNNGVPEQSIAKAYEMMSCFEGLLEYYRATGEEKYFLCAEKFIRKINSREITFLGSGGADGPYNLGPGTGEQWNDTYFEQADPALQLCMETCVTVTYMKLMLNYYRLTGEGACIDMIERSAYNALSGAMKPDGSFFDYFPKFNGKRSTKVNFSYDINGMPLSCCTANGPMGFAILPYMAYTRENGGVNVELYVDSECAELKTETDYPYGGNVKITVKRPGLRRIALRIPSFCTDPDLSEKYRTERGHAVIEREFEEGDVIRLRLDLRLICHPCPEGSYNNIKNKVLYTYGPLVMSRDKSVDPGFDRPVVPCGEYEVLTEPYFHIKTKDAVLIPYSKAGASWDGETEYRSWLDVKERI